ARLQAGRHALVEELRLQPLEPGRALIDQRLPQPDTAAQLEDVHGRDPRLRQLTGEQQPQLQIAIGVVGLRAPLAAAPRGRLRRVGETRNMAGPLDLLDHEPPAGRPLEYKLACQPVEPLKPLTQRLTRRRADPPARALPARRLQRLESELAA